MIKTGPERESTESNDVWKEAGTLLKISYTSSPVLWHVLGESLYLFIHTELVYTREPLKSRFKISINTSFRDFAKQKGVFGNDN